MKLYTVFSIGLKDDYMYFHDNNIRFLMSIWFYFGFSRELDLLVPRLDLLVPYEILKKTQLN